MTDTKPKGHWECKRHGKDCESYVRPMVDGLNRKGVTPKDVLEYEDKDFVEKCLRWVDD